MVEQMTPAEVRAAQAARKAKIDRIVRWAPMGVAGALLLIGLGSTATQIMRAESDPALVASTEQESAAAAESAEAELKSLRAGLAEAATGSSQEQAEYDRDKIEVEIAAIASGDQEAAQRWPQAAEALPRLQGDRTISTIQTASSPEGRSYFVVVTTWSEDPEQEGATQTASAAVDASVDSEGTIAALSSSTISAGSMSVTTTSSAPGAQDTTTTSEDTE